MILAVITVILCLLFLVALFLCFVTVNRWEKQIKKEIEKMSLDEIRNQCDLFAKQKVYSPKNAIRYNMLMEEYKRMG